MRGCERRFESAWSPGTRSERTTKTTMRRRGRPMQAASSSSHLHVQPENRQNGEVVQIRPMRVVEIVADAGHVAVVIDIPAIEESANRSPGEPPRRVEANVARGKRRQARGVGRRGPDRGGVSYVWVLETRWPWLVQVARARAKGRA